MHYFSALVKVFLRNFKQDSETDLKVNLTNIKILENKVTERDAQVVRACMGNLNISCGNGQVT